MSDGLTLEQRVDMLTVQVNQLWERLRMHEGEDTGNWYPPSIQSQRDPRWADVKLGTSGVTIGGYGCAITCWAMWLNAVTRQNNHDPLTVNNALLDFGGYVSGNLLAWQKLPAIYIGVKYDGRIDCPTTPAPLNEIDDMLERDLPVIVYVDFSTAPNLQQHFVLITGKQGDNYVIRDPWHGDESLITRYGKTPQQAICGIIRLGFTP